MSVSSLSAVSPIPHYNSTPPDGGSSITTTTSSIGLTHHHTSPSLLEDSIETSDHHGPAGEGPKMSSPMIHNDSITEYSEGSAAGDSLSSLATSSYSSYPVLRSSYRSGPHYMVPVHVDEVVGSEGMIPNSSPVLRPSSGRLMGGMKKLLRIPSSAQQAGVASSTVHAENPTIAIVTPTIDDTHHELEHTDRKVFINKVFNHIKRPRNHHFSALKRHRVRKHNRSSHDRPRTHHHHYSGDDGYTSDPGILRDNVVIHEEDAEEEDDTESGDPDVEHRIQRITAIENKLDKYKKLLQEEEQILQVFENEYVQGMEGSSSDKETHRIKQKFITKQSKAKETIDHLKKKVVKYEEQLQFIKQGGEMQRQYGSKMKSGIKKIGGMRNELRERLRRKKSTPNNQINVDEDEDDMEERVIEEEEDDMMEEPLNEDPILMKADPPCEYCIADYASYNEITEQLKQHSQDIVDLHKQHKVLLEKYYAERDKSERLESELNTLMDLHQHGVTELREQLTQMERLTFSKNQDLEDIIDNCQSRLHKLEVEVNKTVDEKTTPAPSSWIRRLFVPLLTFLLDFMSFVFRISEHMGKRTAFAVFFAVLAIIVYCWFIYSS